MIKQHFSILIDGILAAGTTAGTLIHAQGEGEYMADALTHPAGIPPEYSTIIYSIVAGVLAPIVKRAGEWTIEILQEKIEQVRERRARRKFEREQKNSEK